MKRILLTGIFALVGVLSFSAKSDAAYNLRGRQLDSTLTTVLNTIEITDQQFTLNPQSDTNNSVNRIGFSRSGNTAAPSIPGPGTFDDRLFTLTGVNFQVDSTTTTPGSGTGQLTFNMLATNTSASAVYLRVTLTSTGFTSPGNGAAIVNSTASSSAWNSSQGIAGTSGTFQSFIGLTNVEYQQSVSTTPQAVNDTGVTPRSAFTTITGTYSITNILTFSLPASPTGNPLTTNTVQFTGTTTVIGVVPAPAGLVLVATAAPVLGAFGWLRRRKTVTSETAAV